MILLRLHCSHSRLFRGKYLIVDKYSFFDATFSRFLNLIICKTIQDLYERKVIGFYDHRYFVADCCFFKRCLAFSIQKN